MAALVEADRITPWLDPCRFAPEEADATFAAIADGSARRSTAAIDTSRT